MLSKKPVVTYICFQDQGGMLHYTLNLKNADNGNFISKFAFIKRNNKEKINNSICISINKILFYKLFLKYNPFFYLYFAFKIKKNQNPSIAHITSHFICLTSLIIFLKFLGIKVFLTIHDPVPHDEYSTIWGKLFKYYQYNIQYQIAFLFIDKIHVHSDKHKKYMIDRYYMINNKIYNVQHGGGLTNIIANGNSIPIELTHKKKHLNPIFLFFGRIEEYKGIDMLLLNCNKLYSNNYQFTLIIAGAGNLSNNEHINNENIIILNRFIKDEEINYIFNLCDLVILPYRNATQTGIIPMAYAYSKPVLCTDVGSLSDMIEHNTTGWLIDADSHSLYKSLRYLLDKNVDFKLYGNNGYNYYKNNLSWDRIKSLHYNYYCKYLLQ